MTAHPFFSIDKDFEMCLEANEFIGLSNECISTEKLQCEGVFNFSKNRKVFDNLFDEEIDKN